MGIDLRALKPSELVQLINSTALGEVITERRLSRHRQAAGLRVASAGDPKRVNLLRYAAWLCARRHGVGSGEAPAEAGEPGDEAKERAQYEAHKDRARARAATIARRGMEIGALPAVADPERRARALGSLKAFCEIYFGDVFYLPWCEAQLQSLKDLERTILQVEMLAEAMPRGWGKSTRFERAVLWAGLNGYRKFGVILGKNNDAALEIMDSIKSVLETNDLFASDFPEVCHPIRMLEGVTQRANAQLYMGARTRIRWGKRELILPTIPGSLASGFIIRTAGLEKGRVLGMKHARPDGTIVRPDLILIDDPQDEEIAASPARVEKLLRKINGPVLRMAGPDQRIAAMCSITVREQDDLAARLIDRTQSPKWHGRKYQTVLAFPRDDRGRFEEAWWSLWQEYWAIRCEAQRRDEGNEEANAFYETNRAAMDAGVVVGWAHKIEPGDVSAVQSAMNWLLDDPHSFWAEAQNEPLVAELGEATFDVDGLLRKVLHIERGLVPADAEKLTAFIDVQKPYLPWMVCAWRQGLAGHVVAFGTWPAQPEAYFTRRGARKTLAREKPGASRAEQLYHGLKQLTGELLGRVWQVDSDHDEAQERSIDLCLVDCNYDTDTVLQFVREQRTSRLMPSRGEGLRPGDRPLTERKAKDNQQLGHHWMIHVPAKRSIRQMFFDTNRWKTMVADGLAAELGAANCITIHEGTRTELRVLLDHLTSEYAEPTEQRGRTLNLWELRPNRENDGWDCLVGCAVAASMMGIKALGHEASARGPRRVLHLSKLQRGGQP